jgi:hypothetical protein
MKNLLSIFVLTVGLGTTISNAQTQSFTPLTTGPYRITNANGLLDLGPTNSYYCHITTDRDRFYFNKPLFLAGNPSIAAYNTNNFTISTDATYYGQTPRMIIMSGTGLAGFGTSNPGAALEVDAPVNTTGFISLSNQTGDYGYGIVSKVNRDLTKSFAMQNNGVEKFLIYGNGNTYIDGTLKVKEIFVQTNVWADYVFAKNYHRMPINELASFIDKNKHLPEMPTTEEITKTGINVAQTQVLLLQKVEELTLYVIDQNKQLAEQNKKMEEQNKKIAELEAKNAH